MKKAFVSGSSRGIGRAIAHELARGGFEVIVNGRTSQTVEAVVNEIRSAGWQAQGYVADLTSPAAAQKMSESFGALDVVVLNAGSGRTPNDANPEPSEVRKVFELNFFAAVQLAHASISKMEAGGNLVFISSIAGCEALGAPIAYSAAKAALLAYAKTLSMKVASRGIRVNSISPGNVLFEGSTWDDKLKKDEPSVRLYIEKEVPLNGFATPLDIAEAVRFLVNSKFITGHNLIVDGGQNKKLI